MQKLRLGGLISFIQGPELIMEYQEEGRLAGSVGRACDS